MLELQLGVADSTHGWVVGRVGLWGLGLAAPAPRFLDTQPLCVTQILTLAVILYVITMKHETREYKLLPMIDVSSAIFFTKCTHGFVDRQSLQLLFTGWCFVLLKMEILTTSLPK